jgi:hypothetical protein
VSKGDVSPQEREALDKQIGLLGQQVAESASKAVEYISSSKMDVSAGSQGMAALMQINSTKNSIADSAVVSSVNSAMKTAAASAPNSNLRAAVGMMAGV